MIERYRWVDRARGYALLMVVLGHLGIPFFGKYITAFHMPLFFFLSGYTFKICDSYPIFFAKKVKRLLVPYLFMGIPLVIASCVTRYFAGIRSFEDYGKVLLKFVVQQRYCTIWFLTCLFLLCQIFFVIVKGTHDNLKYIGSVSILMGIVGILYFNSGGEALLWNIDVCFTAAPFFGAGYLCSAKKEKIEKITKKLSKLVILCVTGLIYIISVTLNVKYSGEVINFATNEYGCLLLSLISVISGITGIYIISNIKVNLVEYLGTHTMIYFSWHQSIILPLLLLCYKRLGIFENDTLISDGVRTLVTFILIFIVLYPVDMLFNTSKLKGCIGK